MGRVRPHETRIGCKAGGVFAFLGASMTALAVVYRPLADLVPYARNSRTHSEAQVDHLLEKLAACWASSWAAS